MQVVMLIFKLCSRLSVLAGFPKDLVDASEDLQVSCLQFYSS